MKISKIAKLDLKDSVIKTIVVNLYAKIVSIDDLEKIIVEFKIDNEIIKRGDK